MLVLISAGAIAADKTKHETPATEPTPATTAGYRYSRVDLDWDIKQLRLHINARQWWLAEQVSTRLISQLTARPPAGFNIKYEETMIVLRGLRAMALVEQNKTDEAIPILHQIIDYDRALRDRYGSGNGMTGITGIIAYSFTKSLDDANLHIDRHLLQRLGIDRKDVAQLSSKVEQPDALPRIDIPQITLIRAYAKKGSSKQALNAFDVEFKMFLDQLKNTALPNSSTAALIESPACLTAAIELSRLGRTAQADEAFECAFNAEDKLTIAWASQLPSPLLTEAIAKRKRSIAGAYAEYLLSASPNASGLSGGDEVRVAELIGQSKGYSSYFQGIRENLINRITGPGMEDARNLHAQLESQFYKLLAGGSDLAVIVSKWIEHQNSINMLAGDEVYEAGLESQLTVEPGVVSRVMKRLHAADSKGGAAYIGFFSYRPFDVERRELRDAIVLRYVISSGGVKIKKIGANREIGALVTGWRNRHLIDSPALDSWNKDQEFSRLLLAGMPTSANDARNWIIDPDSMLNLIPIEALPLPNGNAVDNQTVLDRHAVSYATSMLIYADTNRESLGARPWTNYPGRSLLIADPVFTAGEEGIGPTQESIASRSLLFGRVKVVGGKPLGELKPLALPETRAEIMAVRAALNAKGISNDMYVGKEATPDSLQLRETPAVVHVATHGVFLEPGLLTKDDKFLRLASIMPGMQSALILAAAGDRVLVTGDDIAKLPLQGTQMVVFSACDTGNGEVIAGEGVMSLRQSIEKAGALSSVTSIWSVPSKATTDLMRNFYIELSRGMSKAEALRSAKLTVRKSYKEPRYWAAFLLAGEP